MKVAVAEVVDVGAGDCECAAAGGGWSVGCHCRSRAPRIEMTVGREVRGRESLVWPTAWLLIATIGVLNYWKSRRTMNHETWTPTPKPMPMPMI